MGPDSSASGTTDDLTRMSAADLSDRLAKREVSAVEAAQAHPDRIAATDETVGAFLHVDPQGALDAARGGDRPRSEGEEPRRPAGGPPRPKGNFTPPGG